MTRFDRLNAIAGRATTGVFGERVLIIPRRGGNQYSAATPDPDRASLEVRGIYAEAPAPAADIRGQAIGTQMGGAMAMTAVNSSLVIEGPDAALIPYRLRTGDMIRLVERLGAPGFTVVDVPPMDTGDVFVMLAREASP